MGPSGEQTLLGQRVFFGGRVGRTGTLEALAKPRVQGNYGADVCLVLTRLWGGGIELGVGLAFNDVENRGEVEIAAFGFHPSLFNIDNALLENVALALAGSRAAQQAARQDFQNSRGKAGALEMQACGVESLSNGVVLAVEHVGREDMATEGVGVAKEVGQRDRGKGIVVLVVLRIEFYHGEGVALKSIAFIVGKAGSQARNQ